MPKTKIICTIGPASQGLEMLEKLAAAGMSMARINMSHGSLQQHQVTIETIRSTALRTGVPVAILADLQGPKIRLGEFASAVELPAGAEFTLTTQPVLGSGAMAGVDYAGLPQDVRPGSKIFINDGQVQLQVTAADSEEVRTRVVVGGVVDSHKGVNLPGTEVSLPPLTAKDKADLQFLLEQNVDYIACSFIRSRDNLLQIKQVMSDLGADIPLIAKLETVQGVSNFRSIMESCFGVMLARGDMAIEMPLENIPIVQKVVCKTAAQLAKPVIVATQMLESMTHGLIPTRAEITDVANAVLDGAWGIMLSGETAAGEHPAEVVKTMVKIAERAERAMQDGRIDIQDLLL